MKRPTVNSLTRSYVQHPFLWMLFVIATIVPAGWLASQLSIQSDFKMLLPQDKPSVVELNRIIKNVGGIGNLIVAIESKDHHATIRFIDDLVEKLDKLPEKYVRYIEYNITDIKDFYRQNRYLYIDLPDLKEIHDRLAKKIRYEKLRQNPFFIALEEDKVEFDVSDIERKYEGKTSKYDKFTDGYFFGEENRLAAVLIKPFGTSTGTTFAQALIKEVDIIVQELNPRSYHASLNVHYVGKYQDTLDEYTQLIRDVIETLALCLLLVAVAIYLYFLRLRIIWLLTAALGVGATWTFALAELQIGYLNSQTAFLGSIIIGNGVNSGVILLARYMEERRLGASIETALTKAISMTWTGTLVAAITTSAAFAALSLSEIKGFSHFGFIGGIGMTLCWAATYIVVPPLVVLSERWVPLVKGKRFVSKQWEFLLHPIGSMVAHSPRVVATFGVFVAIGAIAVSLRFLPDSLEYDFSKLKNKPKKTQIGKSVKDRVTDLFGQNTSPSVILLENEEQAAHVCDAIMAMEAGLPHQQQTIDSCRTLRSYLPQDQKEKLRVLAKIRKILDDASLNFLKAKYRKELDDFRALALLKEVGLSDLPVSVQRNFQELDGRLGRIVYVYPQLDARLSNGRRLMRFADTLSDVRLPDGSAVRMSGQAAIFADLLRAVLHDGPLVMLFSFLAVSLLIVVNLRRGRPIIYVLGGLIMGAIYLFGLQSIIGIKLNFFNIIAVPVTFGIGVDYGVNLLQRYRYEGRGSMRRVLGTVGGAILLCSLTTIIGYSTLLTAQSQALASFGWLALIGELSCLFASIVVMPAILHSFDKKFSGKGAPVNKDRRQT